VQLKVLIYQLMMLLYVHLLDLLIEQLQNPKQNLLFIIILLLDIFGIGQMSTRKIFDGMIE
jgi:hypothetical protein